MFITTSLEEITRFPLNSRMTWEEADGRGQPEPVQMSDPNFGFKFMVLMSLKHQE